MSEVMSTARTSQLSARKWHWLEPPQLRLTAPRALPFPMPTSIVNAGMETAHCKPGLHPFTLMSTPNHPVLPRLRRLPGGILKTPSSFNGLTHARRVAFAAAATVIELADLDTITDFAFPAPVSSGDLYRELRQSIPDVADILPVEDEDVEIVERVPPYTPIAALLVVFSSAYPDHFCVGMARWEVQGLAL
ncbi:hypothetical protein N7450_010151 [Penicillium hetheringtonii]|uniref:Uncharacterized protein n=1 Tax=Penicillium hetheringtonii TaxID=911720 RepID=A0AAD6DCL9_9EURO|nr:hypothetical protein N7450_010151 [Penicillium hetheringtonii]